MATSKISVWDPKTKKLKQKTVNVMENDYVQRTLNAPKKTLPAVNTNTSKNTTAKVKTGGKVGAKVNTAENIFSNAAIKKNTTPNTLNFTADPVQNRAQMDKAVKTYQAKNPKQYDKNRVLKELMAKSTFFSTGPLAGSKNSVGSQARYIMATDDELKKYDSLTGKAKSDYIKSLNDTLDQRLGQKEVEYLQGIESKPLKNIATTATSIVGGYDDTLKGVKQSLKGVAGNTEIEGRSAVSEAQKTIAPTLEGGAKFANDIGYTLGQIIPGAMVGIATGGVGAAPVIANLAGATITGLSSGGNTFADTKEQGYSDDQARAYGWINGILEGGLQYALGGVAGTSFGGASKLLGKTGIAKNVAAKLASSPQVIQKVATLAARGGDEFTEEYLQAVLDPIIRNITLGENNKFEPFSADKIYQASLGAIMGAGSNAPSTIAGPAPFAQYAPTKEQYGLPGGSAQDVMTGDRNTQRSRGLSANAPVIYGEALPSEGAPVTQRETALNSETTPEENMPVAQQEETTLPAVPEISTEQRIQQINREIDNARAEMINVGNNLFGTTEKTPVLINEAVAAKQRVDTLTAERTKLQDQAAREKKREITRANKERIEAPKRQVTEYMQSKTAQGQLINDYDLRMLARSGISPDVVKDLNQRVYEAKGYQSMLTQAYHAMEEALNSGNVTTVVNAQNEITELEGRVNEAVSALQEAQNRVFASQKSKNTQDMPGVLPAVNTAEQTTAAQEATPPAAITTDIPKMQTDLSVKNTPGTLPFTSGTSAVGGGVPIRQQSAPVDTLPSAPLSAAESAPNDAKASANLYSEVLRAHDEIKVLENLYNSAANGLTDKEIKIANEIRKSKRTIKQIPPGMDADNIEKAAEIGTAIDQQEAIIRNYRKDYKKALLNQAEELTQNSDDWTDKKAGIWYSREIQERNIMDIAGKTDRANAQNISDTYFEPVHEHEAEGQRFIKLYRDKARALNLSPKEAEIVQMLGEGKTTELEIPKGIDTAKIKNSVDAMRKIYDEVLPMANEILVRNGYKPIDYRKDYFPHFGDGTGVEKMFKKLGFSISLSSLPEDIAGITHQFKPGKKWFGNFMRRTGNKTVYDALEGFDRYINGIKDVIYHTEDIQKLRALETALRGKHTDEAIQDRIDEINSLNLTTEEKDEMIGKLLEDKYDGQLPNYVQNIRNYTDTLAGKKSVGDRGMEIEMGRGTYSIITAMENRVARNMVGLNVGSWLTNVIPFAQGSAGIDTKNMLRGIRDTLKSYARDDGFISQSDFLTNRVGSKPLTASTMDKLGDIVSKPMYLIDRFTSESITRAKYLEELESGKTPEEAMKIADRNAANVIADRSYGALPTIFNKKNPFTKLLTMFNVEVNNQYSYLFKDLPREAKEKGIAWLVFGLIKYLVGSFLYNEIYEKLTGRRPAFDPVGMVKEAVGDYTNPNVTKTQATTNAITNAAEQLPFIGGLLGGGRIPINSALPFAGNLEDTANFIGGATSGELTPGQIGQTMRNEFMKPAYYIGAPFGGGQAKKAIESLNDISKGGAYTQSKDGEKLKYTVAQTAPNVLQGVLFGKYALPEARNYYDNAGTPLSVKQTQSVKDAAAQYNVPTDQYIGYLKEAGTLESVKDSDGKAIPGSVKAQKVDLIENSDMGDTQKYGVYYNEIFSEQEQAASALASAAGVNPNDILNIYRQSSAVEPVKNAKGKSIANSTGVQIKSIIDTAITDEMQRDILYEMFDLGDTVKSGEATQTDIDNAIEKEQTLQRLGIIEQSGEAVSAGAADVDYSAIPDVPLIKDAGSVEITADQMDKTMLNKLSEIGMNPKDYYYIKERIDAFDGAEKTSYLESLGFSGKQMAGAVEEFVMSNKQKASMTLFADAGGNKDEYVNAFIVQSGFQSGTKKAEKLAYNEQLIEYLKNSNMTRAEKYTIYNLFLKSGTQYATAAEGDTLTIDGEINADTYNEQLIKMLKNSAYPLAERRRLWNLYMREGGKYSKFEGVL